jgi:hypothetical protein
MNSLKKKRQVNIVELKNAGCNLTIMKKGTGGKHKEVRTENLLEHCQKSN